MVDGNVSGAVSGARVLEGLHRLLPDTRSSLQGCSFASRTVDAGDAHGGLGGGPSSRRWL